MAIALNAIGTLAALMEVHGRKINTQYVGEISPAGLRGIRDVLCEGQTSPPECKLYAPKKNLSKPLLLVVTGNPIWGEGAKDNGPYVPPDGMVEIDFDQFIATAT